jgi:hypothetical protein
MRPGYDIPPVRTNSFGLRSPEVPVPKPPGTFRILLLGDSFTFGFMSGEESVFARKLERRLRDRDGASVIEVVNAGVLSYCPLLEYLQYRHHLQALDPDLVILNFDMSDVQDHLEYSRSAVFDEHGEALFVKEPSLGSPVDRRTSLLSFRWVARYLRAATRLRESRSEGVPFARDADRYLWALDNGPELQREVEATLRPIASLARLLDHRKIPLVLATYPQPWQVSKDATPQPPTPAAVRQCDAGVPVGPRSGRALPSERLPLQPTRQRLVCRGTGPLPRRERLACDRTPVNASMLQEGQP